MVEMSPSAAATVSDAWSLDTAQLHQDCVRVATFPFYAVKMKKALPKGSTSQPGPASTIEALVLKESAAE